MTLTHSIISALYSKITEKFGFSAIWVNALIQTAHKKNIRLSELVSSDDNVLLRTLQIPQKDLNRFKVLMATADRAKGILSLLAQTGIHTVLIDEPCYPSRLRIKLGDYAPPILFYHGKLSLTEERAIAVCGPRLTTDFDISLSHRLGELCAKGNIVGVSGGARGVDSEFQSTCLHHGGSMVIFLPCGISNKYRTGQYPEAMNAGQVVYISHIAPYSPFETPAALERNHFIYSCCDFSLVTGARFRTGGSWAGASDNLRRRASPLFVGKVDLPGNRALIEMGGIALSHGDVAYTDNIFELFSSLSLVPPPLPVL